MTLELILYIVAFNLGIAVFNLAVKLALFFIVRGYLLRAEELLGAVKAWANLARTEREQANALTQLGAQYAAEVDNGSVAKGVEEVKHAVDRVDEAVREVPKQVAKEIREHSESTENHS